MDQKLTLKQLQEWWLAACHKKCGDWALTGRGLLRHHTKRGPGRRHQQGK